MAAKKVIKTTEEKEVKVTKKVPVKAVKKVTVEETVSAPKVTAKTKEKVSPAKTTVDTKESSLTISVFDASGKEFETMTLPEEIFGAKVNPILMAQAVRVYLANQRQGNASTKTRGEVTGSTRKIYRQKGTGRARHGGVRAPIFVKGGIAHGPKPQDHSLSMPKKMKRAALFSALTAKLIADGVKIVSGLESVEPKTKNMAVALNHFGLSDKKTKILLVTPENIASVIRGGSNLAGVTITAADRLNTYQVLNTKKLIFMKDAIETMQKVFLKK
ncbi:MAG TPA: 50S ribosomal protein L4 [Candidatus Saccharimonadales bacterium]|nr:50S ribosomal protein L4 [Candidatus Saccharimonadales bacterium]